MKLPLLALLCVASAAYCQSPRPSQVNPDKLFQLPGKYAPPAPGFTPPLANIRELTTPIPPIHLFTPRPDTPGPGLNNPQIDPKIIVHPPWPHPGAQPQGEEVSRNGYPNLKFLPIRKDAQRHK